MFFTFQLLEARRKQEEKEKEEVPWNELDVSTPELVITTDNIQDSKKVSTEDYFQICAVVFYEVRLIAMVIVAWSKHLPFKILGAPPIVLLSEIGKAKLQLLSSKFEYAVHVDTD